MKKLLLVGAGHAHLYILKQLQRSQLPDVDVTLLNPFEHQYISEMFSWYAEGLYELDDIRIDISRLVDGAGIPWVQEAAVSIDPDQKVVLTDEGKVLAYDAVSFDIGSLTAETGLTGVLEHAETIRPNARFPNAIDRMRQSKRAVIVGGGVAGAEMALSLQTWRNQNGKGSLTLTSEGGLLEHEVPQAAGKVETLARQKGVSFHLHDGVEAVMPNQIVTASNRKISFDGLLWLTGPRAHHLFAGSVLPIDGEGYLSVEETLQVKRYPSVFGSGECVSINGYSHRVIAGIDKIKQAAILWGNLKGFFGEGDGHLYKPQPPSLSVLSTGGRRGLMLYKGKVFYGKWPWLFKRRMDRQLMRSYC